ncbi:MAG: radical SAM protein [Planctomycetota bacterium]|jgi:SynChlorMet cassette radical SAM/SPASM protein ScmF
MGCDTNLPKPPKADRPEPGTVPPLQAIYFYPTERCNLRCPHCWVDPDWVKTPEEYQAKFSGENAEISQDMFRRVVQEAKPLGLARIKFTGGEPFLRHDIDGFFRICKEEEIPFDVETNATLVDGERARLMKECGCFHAAVSLDSPTPEFHDRFRGMKGAYEKTVQGIEHLKRYGHNVQIIQSLCKDNEDTLESMVRFAKEVGVSSLKINPVTPGGRGKKYFEHKACEIKTLIDMLPVAEKEYSNRYSIRVIFSLPMAFHSFEDIANNRIGRCAVFNIIGLLSDGSVSLCGIGKTEQELVAGRVDGRSLEEIWSNGKVFRDIREKLPRKLEGACKKCIFKGSCLGYCVANSFTMDRDLFSGYWFCTKASERSLFSKTRCS